jgi:ubiquinone biosynthesis protein Coq4
MKKVSKKVSSIAKFSYHGLRVLLRPHDTESLLKLGNVISDSKAFRFNLGQLKKNKAVSNLIKQRYSSGIPDLKVLEKYPNGTLGQKLFKHFKTFGLKPYPFPIKTSYSGIEYVRERQREVHDVLHALLNLGVDVTSEASVNAFVAAQSGAPIAALIVGGSIIRMALYEPQNLLYHLDQVTTFFKLGRKSKNIFGLKWEELLEWEVEKVEKLIFKGSSEKFDSALNLEIL